MKCLSVRGPGPLCEEFVRVFRRHLPGRTIAVLRRGDDGDLGLETTGFAETADCLRSPLPDIILPIRAGGDLAVPEVRCREDGEVPWERLELARFTLDCDRPLLKVRNEAPAPGLEEGCGILFARTHHFLPQFDKAQCGRCGADCQEFSKTVVSGERSADECFFAPSTGLRVLVDGEPMRMGRFPSEIIEGTLRGLFSSLDGYREDADMTVELPGN